MEWLRKTFIYSIATLSALIVVPIVVKLLLKPGPCEISNVGPQKESLQNNNFYMEMFGSKKCAPKSIVFTIPVRQRLKKQPIQVGSKQQELNSPEIISVLTISDKPQSFYVKRIDESANGFNVKGNTCIAWKWLQQEQGQTLNISLARNLQIYDPSIKKIIFIVSLPAEFQQARTTLYVRRSVLKEDGNSQAGEVIPIRLQKEAPKLFSALRQKYASAQSSKLQSWASGAPVQTETSAELSSLTERVGVYIDSPVSKIQDASDTIESYEKISQETICEVPKSLLSTN